MVRPKLYMDKISPAVRPVLMCAKAIDLELELIEVNLLKKDHLKPEFIKLNPLHTVPTLDDSGLILYDSHAIMGYLIEKYAKDKSLYPTDVEKRALVDLRLYFDSSVLFARYILLSLPVIIDHKKQISEQNLAAVREAYGYLEIILKDNKYVAGDNLSIADFSLINTLTNASAFVPLDESEYPNIASWRRNLETLPYYDICREGGEMYKTAVQNVLSE